MFDVLGVPSKFVRHIHKGESVPVAGMHALTEEAAGKINFWPKTLSYLIQNRDWRDAPIADTHSGTMFGDAVGDLQQMVGFAATSLFLPISVQQIREGRGFRGALGDLKKGKFPEEALGAVGLKKLPSNLINGPEAKFPVWMDQRLAMRPQPPQPANQEAAKLRGQLLDRVRDGDYIGRDLVNAIRDGKLTMAQADDIAVRSSYDPMVLRFKRLHTPEMEEAMKIAPEQYREEFGDILTIRQSQETLRALRNKEKLVGRLGGADLALRNDMRKERQAAARREAERVVRRRLADITSADDKDRLAEQIDAELLGSASGVVPSAP